MMASFEMKISCLTPTGTTTNFGPGHSQIQHEVCPLDVHGDGSDTEGGLIGRTAAAGGGAGLS